MSIKIRTRQKLFKNHVFKRYFVYFQFLLHNSHDKFDIQIIVLNQINHEETITVVLGSEKEFVVTVAWTHSPRHGTAYWWSEPSLIPLSYKDFDNNVKLKKINRWHSTRSRTMPASGIATTSWRSTARRSSRWLTTSARSSSSLPEMRFTWRSKGWEDSLTHAALIYRDQANGAVYKLGGEHRDQYYKTIFTVIELL